MSRQLILDLPVRVALGRGDFLVAPANALALAAVDGWRNWPAGRLLLTGPAGAGKTHLARLWQGDRPGTAWIEGRSLPLGDIAALAGAGAVVDGAEGVAGDPAGERALLHLLNLAAEAGAPVLLTAPGAVRDWGVGLPDLESRLAAAPRAELDPPDDDLLAAVLVKLFADRQVTVAPELIDWLLPRMERSLAEAGRLVARLDAEALARGRAITPRLAAEVLSGGA